MADYLISFLIVGAYLLGAFALLVAVAAVLFMRAVDSADRRDRDADHFGIAHAPSVAPGASRAGGATDHPPAGRAALARAALARGEIGA